MDASAFSLRYEQALQFAARAHRRQVRKGTDIPYIVHAVHVSVILLRHRFDEDVVIAGLLHDVVEDCGVTPQELAALFGAEVARLVEAVSERKRNGGSERAWEERKTEAIAHLRNGDSKIAALKAADALHNIHSIVADAALVGAAVWQRFKRGPDRMLWYYHEILAAVRETLGDHPIVAELARAIADLEHTVHEYN